MVLEEVPRILGEVLPFHETATTDKEKHLTRVCAYKMNEALVGMDLMKHALKLPPKDRSCLAGWLYEHCARTMRESYDEAEAAGIYSLEHKTRIRSTQRAAEAFKKAKCDGVALSREAEAIAQDVENATAHRSVDP